MILSFISFPSGLSLNKNPKFSFTSMNATFLLFDSERPGLSPELTQCNCPICPSINTALGIEGNKAAEEGLTTGATLLRAGLSRVPWAPDVRIRIINESAVIIVDSLRRNHLCKNARVLLIPGYAAYRHVPGWASRSLYAGAQKDSPLDHALRLWWRTLSAVTSCGGAQ